MALIQAELALNNCQACSDSSELLVAWLSQNAVFPVAGSCRSPLLSLVSGRAGTFFGWAPPRYGTRRGPSWPGCDGFEDCSCFSLHHQFALNLNLTLSNSARGTLTENEPQYKYETSVAQENCDRPMRFRTDMSAST